MSILLNNFKTETFYCIVCKLGANVHFPHKIKNITLRLKEREREREREREAFNLVQRMCEQYSINDKQSTFTTDKKRCK